MKKLVLILAIIVIYQSAFSDDKVKLAWQVDGQNVSYSGMCVSESGKYAFTLFTSADSITCGKFNYDVQMWNIETGEMEKAFPVPKDYFEHGGTTEFSCSADDSRLLVYNSNSSAYWLFDIESGKQLTMKRLGSQFYTEEIRFAELTEDGSMLLTRLSNRNYVEMIYSKTGKTIYKIQLPEGADEYGCISSNSLYFATYFDDGTVKIINTVTGEVEKEVPVDFECEVISLSNNYQYLYCIRDYTVGVFIDVASGEIVDTSLPDNFFPYCEFTSDNSNCLLCPYNLAEPILINLTNLDTMTLNYTLHPGTVAFKNETILIGVGIRMNLMQISIKLGGSEPIGSAFESIGHFGAVTSLQYYSGYNELLSSSIDGTIKSWRSNNGSSSGGYGITGSVSDISTSKDYYHFTDSRLIAAHGNAITIWKQSKVIANVPVSNSRIVDIECFPYKEFNRDFVLISEYQNTVEVWTTEIIENSNEKPVKKYEKQFARSGNTCLAWSETTGKLAVGNWQDMVAVYDLIYLDDGENDLELDTIIYCGSGNVEYYERGISDISFSPDGTQILIITETQEVPVLLSTETYTPIVDFETFAWDEILEAEFLGNSGIIAVGGTLGNITFLDTQTGKVIEKYGELTHKWDYISLTSENLLKTTTMEYLDQDKLLVFGTNYGDIVALDVSELLASSAVEDIPEHKFSIYPNPAENYIKIDAPEFSNVRIFDLTGNMMLEKVGNRVDVSNLTAGIYMIVIENNGEISRQKFIITR